MSAPAPSRKATPAETVDLEFAKAMIEGFSRINRAIPSRFLYDARGSELFEDITELPEYYPTRTEMAILRDAADEIAARMPDGSVLIEFGSGSSLKTEIVLEAAGRLHAYVPVDISPAALADAKARLQKRFASLSVFPITANFFTELKLPDDMAERCKFGFFPGSTIGNLTRDDAARLLRKFGDALGPGAHLIIGVDLQKDKTVLEAAYNDSAGVTAEFNFNLLDRANRELKADFHRDAFSYHVQYNEKIGRIEAYLISRTKQTVEILGRKFELKSNERILTEYSHKYTLDGFATLAQEAGWASTQVWTDDHDLFSVHELTCEG